MKIFALSIPAEDMIKNDIKSNSKKEFKKALEWFYEQLVILNIFYYFVDTILRYEELIDLIEPSKPFWLLTLDSYLASETMIISRLTDREKINDNENLSYKWIIKFLKEHVEPKYCDEIKEFISSVDSNYKKVADNIKDIRDKRNKFIAHFDVSIISNAKKDEKSSSEKTIDNIDKIEKWHNKINQAKEFLNSFYKSLNGKQEFLFIPPNYYEALQKHSFKDRKLTDIEEHIILSGRYSPKITRSDDDIVFGKIIINRIPEAKREDLNNLRQMYRLLIKGLCQKIDKL